jgi:hypothetical protein
VKLEKLTITPRDSGLREIKVLFNPTSYSISKSVSYRGETKTELNSPLLTFGGGDSRKLSLKLFFDVTEPINGREVDDVRELTNKLVALTRIERGKDRPPVCDIAWGSNPPANSDFPFTGVVSSLRQDFTLFEKNGKPLRAEVDVDFTEFVGWEESQRETDPEFTTRVVRLHDTLSSIAAEVYDDPSRWRVIADANRLDDPRLLPVGMLLHIPKLARG